MFVAIVTLLGLLAMLALHFEPPFHLVFGYHQQAP